MSFQETGAKTFHASLTIHSSFDSQSTVDEEKSTQDAAGITWGSPSIQSAFYEYWTTNPSYITAKEAATSTYTTVPDLKGPLIPLFEALGYLEVPDINLDAFVTGGNIHPIFHPTNWITDLPYMKDAYRLMLPALRLVSEILESDLLTEWWLQVRYGKPVRLSRSSPAVLHNGGNIDLAYVETVLKDDMMHFANDVRFTWLCSEKMEGDHAFSVATISALLKILDHKPAKPYRIHRKGTTSSPAIALPLHVYQRLLSSSKFTASQNLRFQFLLAKMLLHEIGHCWYSYWQGPPHKSRWRSPQCETKAFSYDIFGEMGFSLEWHVFGANVSTLDFGKYGCATVGPLVATRPEDEYPIANPAMAFVPMEWVVRLFRLDTWSSVRTTHAALAPITVDGHPQIYRLARFDDGRLQDRVEVFLEGEAARIAGRLGHEQRSADAIEARKHNSVAAWYGPIWEKEAREALKMGKLPRLYYKSSPTYAHLLGHCALPIWTKRSILRLPKVNAYIMSLKVMPKKD